MFAQTTNLIITVLVMSVCVFSQNNDQDYVDGNRRNEKTNIIRSKEVKNSAKEIVKEAKNISQNSTKNGKKISLANIKELKRSVIRSRMSIRLRSRIGKKVKASSSSPAGKSNFKSIPGRPRIPSIPALPKRKVKSATVTLIGTDNFKKEKYKQHYIERKKKVVEHIKGR